MYLLPPDIGRRRFGLSREDLFFAHFKFDEYQDKVLSIQQSVIPLLEERLKSRCEQLLHLFSPPPSAAAAEPVPVPAVAPKGGATSHATRGASTASAPTPSGVSLLTAKAWQLPRLLSDATAQRQVAISQAIEAERRTELAHFQQFQVWFYFTRADSSVIRLL